MTAIEDDRVKLQADGTVHLFKIELRNGSVLYIKPDNDFTWQGQNWEGFAVQLTGTGQSSDGELSRPTFTLGNPNNIMGNYVNQGVFEKSVVTRYRVLYSNLLANNNIFEKMTWYISRVVSMDDSVVVSELRNPIDGPLFLTPYRMYLPPEFPAVSLFGS